MMLLPLLLTGLVLGQAPAPEAMSPEARANAALAKLQALSAKWPAGSPADYRENLAGDVQALEAALGPATHMRWQRQSSRLPTTWKSS